MHIHTHKHTHAHTQGEDEGGHERDMLDAAQRQEVASTIRGGSGGGYVYLEGARALSLSFSPSLAFRIPSLSLFQNTARIKGAGTFWTR